LTDTPEDSLAEESLADDQELGAETAAPATGGG
jgi:hypothetical protein